MLGQVLPVDRDGLAREPVPEAVERQAAGLAASGSLEIGALRPKDAHAIAEILPSGTPVFVNHLPRHPLAQAIPALLALREAGLEPVPHLAARRIESAAELRHFLARATAEAGVRRALVIGGDLARPLGPYADGRALLAEPALAAHGLREIVLPSYPEGHPRIPLATLEADLAAKLEGAAARGFGTTLLTQFCFQPARIIEHVALLRRRYPELGVQIGLAGPSSPAALLRFARACGVGATLLALSRDGRRAVDLVTHTDPSEQLLALARHLAPLPQSNVVGIHLFSFGAVEAAAAWLNAVMRGGRHARA
ncbi:hypothetical protein [Rhabdaerophilum calidifontis]|uniref:hypothetical protein n=1 Tax=Rhabdaerophilum calidifontis TaxID=2604328 RepID=UPI00123B84DE|nr:hypothetical protein [Rhabdaerophilum calidifontis]